VAEGLPRGVDHAGGSRGIGQVRADVVGPSARIPDLGDDALGTAGIGAPRLLGVVRDPGVHEHGGTVGGQPAGDRGTDRDPPADPGDEGDAALER
jgi:hypothetical protein